MIAITREVEPHLDRCEVIALEADPDVPGAVLVQDGAVVLDEIAAAAALAEPAAKEGSP